MENDVRHRARHQCRAGCLLLILVAYHLPSKEALGVVELKLLIQRVDQQLLKSIGLEALEAEEIKDGNHVTVSAENQF